MIVTEKNNCLVKCIRCGKEVPPTKLYNFDGENGYCLDCLIGIQIGNPILEHSYRPIPTFCHLSTEKEGKRRKLLYLGIELEIEHRSQDLTQHAYSIQKEYPIYAKSDGSLQGGFELVSHPQTAKYHQKIFNWYKLLGRLRKDKFTSYDNGRCGLHIHVNKNFFNQKDDILKTVLFFYKCFGKIKRFAKRRDRDCAEFCKRWKESLINIVKAYKGNVSIGEVNADRYSCINLQNRDTVEFRIYRGTLNYDRFLASIIFTDAICNFVKNYSIAFFANDNYKMPTLWGKFIEYIQKNDKYNFLDKYFQKNNLDNTKVSKSPPPLHEDYGNKDYETEVEIIKDLKKRLKGTGLEPFVLKGLEYEIIKGELDNINIGDGNQYYIYSRDGTVQFLVPKYIRRIRLEKRKVISPIIAKIINLYMAHSGHVLRMIDEDNNLIAEVTSVRELFEQVIGKLYDSYHSITTIEKRVEKFIMESPFEYEILRRDVI